MVPGHHPDGRQDANRHVYFIAPGVTDGFLDAPDSLEEHDNSHLDGAHEPSRRSQHCQDGKQADHVTPLE
jgi:hypothetical protein